MTGPRRTYPVVCSRCRTAFEVRQMWAARNPEILCLECLRKQNGWTPPK